MRDALRFPIAAAAVLAASRVGFESYYAPPRSTGWASSQERPKKRNHNASKQAAAKRARKITKRNRP